jgi:4-diphosphocytidyl-2-C-methyl-D-erythritol kinase
MRDWPAPAKLNLFLHVTGRRADGFHELQTLFQFLDFGDTLQFEVDDSGEVRHSARLAGISGDNELSLRAARALQRYTGSGKGARLTLTKQIPVGGGLGGGSSDAATTLIALNHLWGLELSIDELAEIGLGLGADIPVFVRGHAAWAEGVGEQLTPVTPDEPWYLVLCPAVSVSTAEIFADPELTRDSPAITIRAFREGGTRNDLEPLVRRRYPDIDSTIKWLAQSGQPRMTGSGACVFMTVDSRQQGEKLLTQAIASDPPISNGLTGFVAKGLNRHPLYQPGAVSR